MRALRGRHRAGSKVIRMGNSDSSESHLPTLHTRLRLPSEQLGEARLGYRRERQGSERLSNFI